MIKSVMISAIMSTAITFMGSEGPVAEEPAKGPYVQVEVMEEGPHVQAEAREEWMEEIQISDGFENLEEVEAADESEIWEEVSASSTELTMLSNDRDAQMLSVIIHSETGSTVVIDGGWAEDGEYLLDAIKRKGGNVDAWLITHPHADHVGALYYILQNRSDEINIDRIYYSFAPLTWYEEESPEEAPMVSSIMDVLDSLPRDMVCDSIGKGYEIEAGDIHIKVLNDRYKMFSDPINNSSMVYSVEAGGQKTLFLGDMGFDGGNQLLRDAKDDLRSDIVQVAHHGQNGVGEKVYSAISPQICLWPTPQWLWDNDEGNGHDSGRWRTLETRGWLRSAQSYCTKDGDIVLQLN